MEKEIDIMETAPFTAISLYRLFNAKFGQVEPFIKIIEKQNRVRYKNGTRFRNTQIILSNSIMYN